MPSKTVFVQCDWSQMESWLTGWYAKDEVMLGELRASLAGGYKIHALNAALLYGIDPDDAKSHRVQMQGQLRPAYDAGKRVAHLWNYGGTAAKISQVLWLDKKFAEQAEAKLAGKYQATARWRKDIADQVFGKGRFVCARCRHEDTAAGRCPRCTTWQVPVELQFKGWVEPPRRAFYTVFRRRRLYPGPRKDAMKALASQPAQSTGASIWLRSLHRINGFEAVDGVRETWPVPPVPYRVVSGKYDDFLVECYEVDADNIMSWMLWTMEQPWPQLEGLRLPAEGSIGENAAEGHPRGLVDRDYVAFSAVNPWAKPLPKLRLGAS